MDQPSLTTPLSPRWLEKRCHNHPILVGLVLALAVALVGCDRNIEPYQPGEEPRAPDLARIFPGPPPEAQARTGAGAPDRTALPPSRAAGSERTVPAAAVGGSAPIEGRIELADELADARPGGGVLFVIARPQGARGGPPLAVLRVPDPDFPFRFRIGPENVMIPTMRFEGPISLSARLDADGNAMTRGAGDISSSVAESLTPGTTGVQLVLSERG